MADLLGRSYLSVAYAAIAHPRRTLALCALVTLAAAAGLSRLELRTDGRALVPTQDPAVVLDRDVRRHFGLSDPIVALLETSHPDGIFNPASLERLRDATAALQALPEIPAGHVLSLANQRRPRFYPGTWRSRTFLDPLPRTLEELGEVRSDLADLRVLEGILVSKDGQAATILVGVDPDGGPAGSRSRACKRVREILARFETETDRFLVVGAPVAESLLGEHITGDLLRLLPLSLGLIALVLWLGCRRLWGVLLGLTKVAACLAFTFGWNGWVGLPVYLTTAVLPVILTTVGLADEIHLIWHFQRLLRTPGGPEPVRRLMDELARPLAVKGITTATGFLSFLACPIEAVRGFGVSAAVGVLFCTLLSLCAVPAALVLLSPGRLRHPHAGARRARPWIVRLSTPLLARPRFTGGLLLLVSAVMALGTLRLEVQDSWIDGFAPRSPFRLATERANAALHGTHTLLVQLTFAARGGGSTPQHGLWRGPLLDAHALEGVGRLEAFLKGRPEVGGVLGLHEQLATVAYLWGGRRDALGAIPGDAGRLAVLMGRFDHTLGTARRREVVDDDLRRTVVRVFLKNANYRETARLLAGIRAHEREYLEPLGARVDFAGDVAVSQAMIPAIASGQVGSLVLALVANLLVVFLHYRSPRDALSAAAPACLAVLWTFGAMGWLGIPLGVATSMFCAITMGIGDDYGIHFLERVRHARAAGLAAPVQHAVATAGPSIVADALAVGSGFGLLVASHVPANARLGLLVAGGLGVSCVLTILGLGALLGAAESASAGFRFPALRKGRMMRA